MKRTTAVVLVLTVCFGAAVVAVALIARSDDPANWRSDDWAAAAITCLIGALFGVLAWIIQRRQGQLIDAVANGKLRETSGTIVTDSLRTLTGPVDLSLHVAREARAAMPLFELAGTPEQEELLQAIVDGYGALMLNTFPRTGLLPRSSLERLRSDGRALAADLRSSHSASSSHYSAAQVAAFIDECLDIEAAGRLFVDRVHQAAHRPIELGQLKLLYGKRDLRVLHKWDADHMQETSCVVEFHQDLEQFAGYYAPWYIDPAGRCEVDFTGVIRSDTCVLDDSDTRVLPRFPVPLTHAQVRATTRFRKSSIDMMGAVLRDTFSNGAMSPSFALLAFELPTGERLVLDGNHRLAAAMRRFVDLDRPSLVYVFVVRQGHNASTSPTTRSDGGQEFDGFNPDVNHLRAAVLAGKSVQIGPTQL